MKHTPGPWKAVADTDIRGNPNWRIHSNTIGDLACLTFCNTEDRDTFGKENAKLIAAAPELLAALDDLVVLAEYFQSELSKDHHAVKAAWEAINKATL